MKKFLMFCMAAFLWFGGQAFAEEYMVVRKIAPITARPGAKYKHNTEKVPYIIENDIAGSIVYGNIVEAFPIKGKESAKWMELKVGSESVGFIEKNALAKMPAYERLDAERFWVKEDNTQLFVLPASKPISKEYGGISLPRGITVTGIGELKLKKGTETWILLVFESFSIRIEESDGAGISYGDRKAVSRFAWAKLSDLVRLRDYSPDNSKVDAKFIPNIVIKEQALRKHDFPIKGKVREQFIKNGFQIDPEPVILGFLNIDDLIESYSNLVPDDERLMIASPTHWFPNSRSLLPKFVTVDFALHTFHLIFDRLLQKAESNYLSPRLSEFLDAMIEKISGENEKDEVSEFVLQYLLLAQKLLTETGELSDDAQREYEKIMAAGSLSKSFFTGKIEDYTFYKPRGHYTISDEFERYFRATALLGGVSFSLNDQAGVIAKIRSLMEDEKILSFWKKLSDPMTNLIGMSEENEGGFRLLGRRVTFDSMLFGVLTSKDIGTVEMPRNLPDVVDVMAVLGSKAAVEETKAFHVFEKYAEKQAELINQWKNFSDSPLSRNFYTKWLSLYETYFAPSGSEQYFHGTSAWDYKKLLTASASYAELKHDTILYGEQNGAEMGEGPDYFVAAPFRYPMPLGYVEPEPALFKKLSDCALSLAKFLKDTGIEDDEYDEKLNSFSQLTLRLGSIAEKQIKDEPISFEDYEYIHSEFLSGIDKIVKPEELLNVIYDEENHHVLEQLRMALVADIYTDAMGEKILYVATGAPRQLQVFVNDKNGGGRVTFGYMFSFYNFERDLDEGRMNDSEWKKLVYHRWKHIEVEKLLPSWYEKVN